MHAMKKSLLIMLFLGIAISYLAAQNEVSLVGHRGGSSLGPENTLSAIKRGMLSGMDCIEIDIHQTADSILVLSHDETLNRCTNGNGRIDAHTFSQINQLDAGSWFSDEFIGEKVPTLAEALSLVNGRCELWIEIKGNAKEYPGLEERLVELIQKHDAYNWVQILSFETEALRRIHKMDSSIRLQQLLVSNLSALPFYMNKRLHWGSPKKLDFVQSYGIYGKAIHAPLIRRIHSWGKKVNAWTINQEKQMRHLLEIGIDGITTDYPHLLKSVQEP